MLLRAGRNTYTDTYCIRRQLRLRHLRLPGLLRLLLHQRRQYGYHDNYT